MDSVHDRHILNWDVSNSVDHHTMNNSNVMRMCHNLLMKTDDVDRMIHPVDIVLVEYRMKVMA